MKQFLCLKDLVMKADGSIELTAGKLYRETKPFGDYENAVINNSSETHNNVHSWGIFVDTFERDGVEWIKHDGGDCPVPNFWEVEVIINGFTYSDMPADHWDWFKYPSVTHSIEAYRIISTEEPETEEVELHLFRNDSDERNLSPQEAAYAENMAEKDEDESGAGGGKTFPSSSLRDMTDKTFANLLGMNQFIGDE